MAADPIRNAGGPHLRAAGVQVHVLFERHSRMVYGLCRALLRDPDDADDATQATFVAAYQSLLAGNRVRDPAAWLATIARNECAARSRSRMREPLPLPDADLVQIQGPDAELERMAVVAELRQAIAGLPEKQREAVVLRDLYGLPYTEVGAALGISLASVESLLFRARRSLRISLRTLAGGALTVPVAVREGVAQALPALGAGGGGAASGAVGIGLIAKIASGPATLKAAAGLAAALAAGSIAVARVEHSGTTRPTHRPTRAAAPATAPSTHAPLVAAAPADATEGGSGSQGSSGQRGDDSSSGSSAGHRSGHDGSSGSGSGEAKTSSDRQGGGEGSSDHEVVAGPTVKDDTGESTQVPSSPSGSSGGKTAEQGSSGGHGGDDGGGATSSSGPGSGDDGGVQQGSGGGSGSGETGGTSTDDSITHTVSDGSGSSGGLGGSDGSGDTSGSGSGDSGGSHGGDVGQDDSGGPRLPE